MDGSFAEFTYDIKNQLKTKTENYADGNLERTTTYTYDNLGNVLTGVVKDSKDSLISQENYSYDAYGRKTEV